MTELFSVAVILLAIWVFVYILDPVLSAMDDRNASRKKNYNHIPERSFRGRIYNRSYDLRDRKLGRKL